MCLKKQTLGYYGAVVNLSIHGLFAFVAAVEERQKELSTHDVLMDAELKTTFQAYFHDKPICAAVQSSGGLLDGFERAKDTVFRLVDDLIDELYRPGTFIPGDFLDTFYPAIRKRVADQFGLELPMLPYTARKASEVELLAA
ncbi:MAG: hypothetical protein RI947_1078 [Candidatus Parcubacteria bacterium]|jgi:hypothetical protein